MSKPYPLHFSLLAGDTLHLTTEQMGAYILLLGAMWNAGGVLSGDIGQLRRITRVSARRWPKVWQAVAPFFLTMTDGRLTHRSMEGVA